MFSRQIECIRAREVNSRIEQLGGIQFRQRGSHRFYRVTAANGDTATTVIPQYTGNVNLGTLHSIERSLEPVLGKGWLAK